MKLGMHAVIIVGNDPDFNRKQGQQLAKEATSFQENVYWISSDGLSVKDKVVEELLERLSYKPLIGDINVAVIDDADTMTERAQNRLLKTLEEPVGKVLIILLSTNEENLLPTIRSRCAIYRLQGEMRDVAISESNEKIARALTEGKPYYFFTETLKEASKDRPSAIKFLNEIKWGIKELMFQEGKYEKAHRIVGIIEEAEKDIHRHVNQAYALKNATIQILEENS